MNSFYKQPIFFQWIEAIIILIFGFYPAILLIEIANDNPVYIFLFLLYIPIGQFSFTPFFTLTGLYKYYSPMLLGYLPNTTQIDLHSGGSFDYLFVLSKQKSGSTIKNRIILYHLEGLLHIIKLVEENAIPKTVNIVATSYFFNERTINKFGFKNTKPSFFYRLNLMINFIDIFWMYSLSKGYLAIPKLWEAKKAEISGQELLEKKQILLRVYHALSIKYIS